MGLVVVDPKSSADAALAAADIDEAGVQVVAPDLEGDDLPGPDAGFEHEPHDHFVATMMKALP